MPNYIIYSPGSSPVANLVTGYRRSWPKEREAELGANILIDPNVSGINLEQAKVSGGVVVALSAAEIQQVNDAKAAAALSGLKQAAKDLMIEPVGYHQQAIRLAIITVLLDVMLPLINTLRTQPTTSFAALTNTQVENTFKTGYEARVDALS